VAAPTQRVDAMVPRGSASVSSTSMGSRSPAVRLLIVIAVVVLVGSPSWTAGRADPSRVQAPGRGEGWIDHLPQLEGLLSSLSRLSIGELKRAIERSRPLPISALLAATAFLGVGVLSRSLSLRRAGRQPSFSPRHRVAGPRAPPLQLV